MSRDRKSETACCYGFPRVSGDEPFHSTIELYGKLFSPRERG